MMLLSLLVSSAFAHGGRTDSNGGHHDNKNGGYHYHDGGVSEKSIRPSSYGASYGYSPPERIRSTTDQYNVEGEILSWPILDCTPTRSLTKIGDKFTCDSIQFKVLAITDYDHDFNPIRGGNSLSHYLNSCYQSAQKIDGIDNAIICNRAILSVSFTDEGKKELELIKSKEAKDSKLKEDIKSLSKTFDDEKTKLEKDILDLQFKRKTFLEEYDLFRKDVASFDKKYSSFQSEVLSFKAEKEKFESDLIKFNDSKKILYREESKDVCGRLAYKLYKKYKKNPKKYESNIDSFAYKSKFGTKCGGIKYYDLLVPALAAKKCGKLAKDVERSYNSNPQYYGDLSSAVKHYSFDLYCPSVKYEDILFEAKLVK